MLEYSKEEMHDAVVRHVDSNRGHLEHVFYPLDKQVFNNMGVKVNLLEFVVRQFNKAGYHVHAYEAPCSGFDLWVTKAYTVNSWGDEQADYNYKQDRLPVFYGGL